MSESARRKCQKGSLACRKISSLIDTLDGRISLNQQRKQAEERAKRKEAQTTETTEEKSYPEEKPPAPKTPSKTTYARTVFIKNGKGAFDVIVEEKVQS